MLKSRYNSEEWEKYLQESKDHHRAEDDPNFRSDLVTEDEEEEEEEEEER